MCLLCQQGFCKAHIQEHHGLTAPAQDQSSALAHECCSMPLVTFALWNLVEQQIFGVDSTHCLQVFCQALNGYRIMLLYIG